MANEQAVPQPATNPVESFHKGIISTPKLAAEGDVSDLAAKYAQFRPPGLGGAPTPPVAPEGQEQATVTQETPTPEVAKTDKPFESASVKKDQSFTGTLKKGKEEAEAKAARFEQELKELREQELPRMQQELEEAKLNIEQAQNSKEYKQAQQEMEALKQDHERQRAEWIENQKNLQSELTFHDLQKDPDFVSHIKNPRDIAKVRAEKILGDKALVTEYQKAMNANFASLTAQDPEEQQMQGQIRDSILLDIYNTLDPFKQGQFQNHVNTAVLPAEENYVSALANHEVTKQQIEANRKNQNQQQAYQAQKRWKDAYDTTAQSVSKECEIPEEVGRIIVANNISVDLGNDELIADATIRDGGSQLPVEEVTRLINQGRFFKKQQAYIKGQAALIAELKETINKQRGSSSASDTPTGGFQPEKKADPISKFVEAAKAKGWAT